MISFRQHSGVYTLEVSQFLKIDMNEAWKFFSSPENLATITPPGMGFVITSGQPEKMFPGQIITYKVSPFPGFVTNWITEITHVLAGSYFVDEQRFGPYRMWHHIHRFEEKQSGVLMTDQVSYKLPFGFIGRIAHGLFVKAQLKRIFEFREQKLNELFNT
ncbi:MAG TPA: SRPBCC family protein [Prolixibacteraceae bacterium]|nr:SRPBCC family protein [Prolixibacteraceae bacterium]